MKNNYLDGILFFLLYILLINDISGQRDLEREMHTWGIVNNGIPVRSVTINSTNAEGSLYLSDLWLQTTFYFSDEEEVTQVLSKFNMQDHTFLVRLDNEMFEVDPDNLYRIVLKPPASDSIVLVNGRTYFGTRKLPEDKIYHVLNEGVYSLLSCYSVDIIPPTYILALNTGRKKARIAKNVKNYFLYKNRFVEIPKTKRKAKKELYKYRAILKIAEDQKCKFKDQEDLIRLFQEINKEYQKRIDKKRE